MLWVGLWTVMASNVISNRKAYWHQLHGFPFGPNFNFAEVMSLKRFEWITKMHIFQIPGSTSTQIDPLFQIRDYLKAYNDNLVKAISPGKHICIDESMNQWLGRGCPNIKKIPRKPHSIGQEFKTIADTRTCCIIRLDLCGDNFMINAFENEYPNKKTISTVLRLTEPWHNSGRTIIADSWFGSPAMVRALLQKGLYSIMQVKKRRFWAVGMPQNMTTSLPEEFGSTYFKKSTSDSLFLASFRDLKPQLVIASCGTIDLGNVQQKWDGQQLRIIQRPKVMEEYGKFKGAVDIANNRRDKLPSYHDVIRTERWEMRCLAFFLACAESNAYSSYSEYAYNGKETGHFEFRWKLAQEIVEFYTQTIEEIECRQTRSGSKPTIHKLESFGKNVNGKYIRRRCEICHRRAQTRCKCTVTKAICRACFYSHFNTDT